MVIEGEGEKVRVEKEEVDEREMMPRPGCLRGGPQEGGMQVIIR